jgi:hypothetical protein
MRVVLTDYITHHTGRLFVRLVPVIVQFVHGEEYTPMNRFKAVTHIRQSTPDDDAHGIIEIGLFQLIFDVDWQNFFG